MTIPQQLDLGIHPAEAAWYSTVRIGEPWHAAAERAMKHLAMSRRPFSADDLRDLLAPYGQPPTPNAVGGLFKAWSQQGLIRRAGGGPSRASKRRGGHRHVWQGVGNESR